MVHCSKADDSSLIPMPSRLQYSKYLSMYSTGGEEAWEWDWIRAGREAGLDAAKVVVLWFIQKLKPLQNTLSRQKDYEHAHNIYEKAEPTWI